jgi:hypothetical protein
MANGKCRNHGGRSLKGQDSPSYKHGMRTKESDALRKEGIRLHKMLKAMIEKAGAG